jgi:hypothetical protein
VFASSGRGRKCPRSLGEVGLEARSSLASIGNWALSVCERFRIGPPHANTKTSPYRSQAMQQIWGTGQLQTFKIQKGSPWHDAQQHDTLRDEAWACAAVSLLLLMPAKLV